MPVGASLFRSCLELLSSPNLWAASSSRTSDPVASIVPSKFVRWLLAPLQDIPSACAVFARRSKNGVLLLVIWPVTDTLWFFKVAPEKRDWQSICASGIFDKPKVRDMDVCASARKNSRGYVKVVRWNFTGACMRWNNISVCIKRIWSLTWSLIELGETNF